MKYSPVKLIGYIQFVSNLIQKINEGKKQYFFTLEIITRAFVTLDLPPTKKPRQITSGRGTHIKSY
jgi:hypothetical protein